MKRLLTLMLAVFIASASFADDVMRKTADGTYIVNTTTICNARGYRNATPVEVYIKNGVVVKVETLKNQETRSFFDRIAKYLLPTYQNVKVSKAQKQTSAKAVDGCTGATISMRAIQKNIAAALEYYKKNK